MTAATGFKDHFSEQSTLYARYRPTYPGALFQFLASLCEQHRLAWDCATGNGQAAVALTHHFGQVIATDASKQQIASAADADNVEFRVATAEDSSLDTGSADLVTVGQALHWFDCPQFFEEARRVLVPRGVLAVWCYELCHVSKACDEIVRELYEDIVGEFWPPERALIEEGYASIAMPGEEAVVPAFDMTADWTAGDMLGYLHTWSACKRFETQHGTDPVDQVAEALGAAWGDTVRTVRWPLRVRASRV